MKVLQRINGHTPISAAVSREATIIINLITICAYADVVLLSLRTLENKPSHHENKRDNASQYVHMILQDNTNNMYVHPRNSGRRLLISRLTLCLSLLGPLMPYSRGKKTNGRNKIVE
ncbi:hypothetical protein NPIL_183301 [Nephila pilipes]|uniref:Uncharacterized protein n=1 Tax=Nephila pilipes TaxID=299642 RepID=A0A8X6N4V1_NEPPI|nr:hypothetical protein NPIL_183301 [Nephila pilipes]